MDRIVEAQVLVVGAGNAALCAAIAAAQRGAKVTVLEKAPKEYRGGNSALTTGHLRFAYANVEELLPLINNPSPGDANHLSDIKPKYTQADFHDDLMTATSGKSDPDIVNFLVNQAAHTVRWLRSLGQEWVPQAPTAPFPVGINGAGRGLQTRAFAIAERMGIQFAYDTRAMELLQDEQGHVSGIRALGSQGFVNYHAGATVLACGGFEANAEMRARYLGLNWDSVNIQGVPFNTGDGLRMALDIGALPYGNWTGCLASPAAAGAAPYHLPAVGATFEELGGTEVRRYPFIYGVMVNVYGNRFVDEGEARPNAIAGRVSRAIMAQPGAVAFNIYDAKCRERGLIVGPEQDLARATTLAGLAEKLGVDHRRLEETVRDYNHAVQPGDFDPQRDAGPRTKGINPPKSNWALTIDKPPFEGLTVQPSLTFTFGGLKIDDKGRVVHTMDRPIPGLYTAGEMVGGVFHTGYLVATGVVSGATFGRRSGTNAAEYVLSR